ncbi:MAG: YceH family protein [Ideonella sp.]|nr:YceH family protein [Ideonella sp.]MCC7458769.1 YceH family protein [Nitrospira sp.]
MTRRELSPAEARVLGVLVEKHATVPDTYPLSLNALVAGCNQKTAREPVMSLADADVLQALDALRAASLVLESSGSRVSRYEHNAARAWTLPGAAVALLAVLMLRGPQTAAELRANCERLHRFADISSVEAFLDELQGKSPPFVRRLARAAGEREARWAHLLCGEVAEPAAHPAPAPAVAHDSLRQAADELAAIKAEQARLVAQIDELRAIVARLGDSLGAGRNG